MHPAMLGFLIGLGAAAFFILSQYSLLSKEADETAKRLKKKRVFTEQMRKQMRSVITFSIFLPPAISLGCWMVLPKLGITL